MLQLVEAVEMKGLDLGIWTMMNEANGPTLGQEPTGLQEASWLPVGVGRFHIIAVSKFGNGDIIESKAAAHRLEVGQDVKTEQDFLAGKIVQGDRFVNPTIGVVVRSSAGSCESQDRNHR